MGANLLCDFIVPDDAWNFAAAHPDFLVRGGSRNQPWRHLTAAIGNEPI
jgi:hypothetical protein